MVLVRVHHLIVGVVPMLLLVKKMLMVVGCRRDWMSLPIRIAVSWHWLMHCRRSIAPNFIHLSLESLYLWSCLLVHSTHDLFRNDRWRSLFQRLPCSIVLTQALIALDDMFDQSGGRSFTLVLHHLVNNIAHCVIPLCSFADVVKSILVLKDLFNDEGCHSFGEIAALVHNF